MTCPTNIQRRCLAPSIKPEPTSSQQAATIAVTMTNQSLTPSARIAKLFKSRKDSLLKKSNELHTICGVEICVWVRNDEGSWFYISGYGFPDLNELRSTVSFYPHVIIYGSANAGIDFDWPRLSGHQGSLLTSSIPNRDHLLLLLSQFVMKLAELVM